VSVIVHTFAEIVSALTAKETTKLNSGKFSTEVQNRQIIVTPDGKRLKNKSVVLSGGIVKSGIFYITSAPGAAY
jgi:ribulose-5-phosphate 4-epimerase/fuculose-1-phosphate aldolase